MQPLITAKLTGVPETMLWGLYNRAAEARRPDALIVDPWAIHIADAIQYDYATPAPLAGLSPGTSFARC